MRPASLRARAAIFSLGLALLLGRPLTGAEGQASLEDKVKAGCLYNFAVHTVWPAAAFAGPEAPLIIGLVGEVPFASVLERGVQGKTVQGRTIAVRAVGPGAEAGQCHLLFIGAVEPERVAALLAAVAAKPVLTVSETEGFVQRGGVLNLVKVERSVKFEVSRQAAARAGLTLGSQLLKLALEAKATERSLKE